MQVRLNHTIVYCRDKQASALFLSEILGLPAPTSFGPFSVVQMANDVSLDFLEEGTVHPQHYAFLVDENEFDQIHARILACDIPYWADPERPDRSRRTPTTEAAGCTGWTRTVTSSRSSPFRTAAGRTSVRSRGQQAVDRKLRGRRFCSAEMHPLAAQ